MQTYKPGVYCFWHGIPTEPFPLPTNKVYVGSAQDLEKRLNQHFKNRGSNTDLQEDIAKYGLEAFHISQVTTETHADAKALEQQCLNYLFGKNLPKYNLMAKVSGGCVGTKAEHTELSLKRGGGCVGTKENHRALCLQGRTKAEHRELSASNGGFKAIKRFAMDLTTEKIYAFESSYDAAKLTGVNFGHIPTACKTGKPYIGNNTRWLFSTDKAGLKPELLTAKLTKP